MWVIYQNKVLKNHRFFPFISFSLVKMIPAADKSNV